MNSLPNINMLGAEQARTCTCLHPSEQTLSAPIDLIGGTSSEGLVKIDNQVANELFIAARKGQRIQEFMDAVSGIHKYKLDNYNRQGCIRGMFAKELISDQFLLDIDDVISIFWKGVLEHLDKAKLFGEVVEIKIPGQLTHKRPTNNNPIHFLRMHGYMAVRNYITSLYRKNLEQYCNSCGYHTSIKNNKACPKCNFRMVTVYKFVHDDINIEAHSYIDMVNNINIQTKLNQLLNEFCDTILKPGTRAYQVMKILIDPNVSKDMCSACKLCDAESFDIDSCTNYNANIGRWLGVNKTMIANKIRGIRRRLPEWLIGKGTDDANYLLKVLSDRGII